ASASVSTSTYLDLVMLVSPFAVPTLAQRSDFRQQVLLVDRLEDVVPRALADAPYLVGFLVLAGAQYHRDALRRLVARDDARRLVAVHPRHDHVHQDHVRLLRLRLLDRLLAAPGEAALVAVPHQHLAEGVAVGGRIVDDEDLSDGHDARILHARIRGHDVEDLPGRVRGAPRHARLRADAAAHLHAGRARRLARQDALRVQGRSCEVRAGPLRGAGASLGHALQAGRRSGRDAAWQPRDGAAVDAGHRAPASRVLDLHRRLPDPRPRAPAQGLGRADRRRGAPPNRARDGHRAAAGRLPRHARAGPARAQAGEDAGRPRRGEAAHAGVEGMAVPRAGAGRERDAARLYRGLSRTEDGDDRRAGQPAADAEVRQVLRGHQAD